jgi:hypothetical protein
VDVTRRRDAEDALALSRQREALGLLTLGIPPPRHVHDLAEKAGRALAGENREVDLAPERGAAVAAEQQLGALCLAAGQGLAQGRPAGALVGGGIEVLACHHGNHTGWTPLREALARGEAQSAELLFGR